MGEFALYFASNISFVECEFYIINGLVNVANHITFANSSLSASRIKCITVGSLSIMGNQIDQSVFELKCNTHATITLNRFDVAVSQISDRVVIENSIVAWSFPNVGIGNIYTSIPHNQLVEISGGEYSAYFSTFNRDFAGIFRGDLVSSGDQHPLIIIAQGDYQVIFEYGTLSTPLFVDTIVLPLNVSGFLTAWGYRLDGVPLASYLPALSPSFSDEYAIGLTDLSDGDHALEIWAAPYFGEIEIIFIGFSIDTTAPQIISISPENHTLVGIASPILVISAIEPNLKAAVATIGGSSFELPLSPLTAPIPQSIWDDLSDGAVEIQITLTDLGERSSYTTLLLEKDSTVPSASFLSPLSGSRVKTAPLISVWTSEPVLFDSITIGAMGASPFVNNSLLPDFNTWPDGEIAFTITGHDMADNPFSISSSVVKDTTAPAIEISAPYVAGQKNPVVFIRISDVNFFYANISSGGSVITITEKLIYLDAMIEWEPLNHGDTFSIVVIAVDDLGNNRTSIHTIIKDLVAPEITAEILSSRLVSSVDETLSFSIIATDDHLKAVYYSLDNVEWVLIDGDIAVSDYIETVFVDSVALSSGFITVYFKAVDWADNEATTSQQIYAEFKGEVGWLRAARDSVVAHWDLYLLALVALGISIALIKRRKA
jgi:hypothetical protein